MFLAGVRTGYATSETSHFRRYIDPLALRVQLELCGFSVREQAMGHGLAIYG